MDFETRIIEWIRDDPERMVALEAVSRLDLNDCCIAAGFVRNLVWDRLHEKNPLTPLNDVDVIYFDPANPCAETDSSLEARLEAMSSLPWSVKNQARMHLRNGDRAYTSTRDAMSHWVELETAVGVRLSRRGRMEVIAPFGTARLFENSITRNRRRRQSSDFYDRVEDKQWLTRWPNLKVFA
jgi:hypothetical protein